jgi:hypothetical protein
MKSGREEGDGWIHFKALTWITRYGTVIGERKRKGYLKI